MTYHVCCKSWQVMQENTVVLQRSLHTAKCQISNDADELYLLKCSTLNFQIPLSSS